MGLKVVDSEEGEGLKRIWVVDMEMDGREYLKSRNPKSMKNSRFDCSWFEKLNLRGIIQGENFEI